MDDILNAIDGSDERRTQKSQLSKIQDNCNRLLFRDLCRNFEDIEKLSGSERKFNVIFNKKLKSCLAGQSIFPLMRLVLPIIDTERGKYNLKQTAVAKVYVDALRLDKKTSEDAQRLIFWKDPTKAQGTDLSKMVIGDFCSILENVLKTRVKSEYSSKTIGEVNQILDALAIAHGKDEKIAVIRDQIINNFCAVEQKWLMRIVFQDLKIGLKHEAALKLLSPTALQRYNECTNLKTVCEEEDAGVEMGGLTIFTQFSPMLAKGFLRARSGEGQVDCVEGTMKGQPFVMDVKLDGERMLIHVKDGKVMMFSRNSNDYSDVYCHLGQSVMQQVTASQYILDGEVCAWDNIAKCFMPFGHNAEAGREEREAADSRGISRSSQSSGRPWERLSKWLVFVVFDVVYLDGPGANDIIQNAVRMFQPAAAAAAATEADRPVESGGSITHLPLIVRREVLKNIVNFIDNRIEMVRHNLVLSLNPTVRKQALEDFFNEVTLAGEEGLVVKNLASTYELGLQSKALELWVKMKPEYGDQTEDLDLVILGGYYGEGKSMRGRGLSTFLLGVRCGSPTDPQPGFRVLGKVGTGYSFEQLKELREKLAEIAVAWDIKHPPEHLAHWKIGKTADRPNVYFPPEKSYVVELKCAEIVDSTQFSAGITCRFPRLQRIRYDKPVSDALTMEELMTIRTRPRRLVASQEGDTQSSDGRSVGRKRGRGAAAASDVGYMDEFASQQSNRSEKRGAGHSVDSMFRLTSTVAARQGHMFEGQVYCILDDDFQAEDKRWTRDELTIALRSQGGVVIASVRPDVVIIAGSKRTARIQMHIKKGANDVIDFRYILACLNAGDRLPLRNRWFLGRSQESEQRWLGQVDACGDHYTEELDESELLHLLGVIDVDSLSDRVVDRQKPAKTTKKQADTYSIKCGKYAYSVAVKDSEARTALVELQHLSACSWREVAATLEPSELQVLPREPNCLWSPDVYVFFDLEPAYSYSQRDSPPDPRDVNIDLAAVSVRMSLRGCAVSAVLTTEVTHVVVPDQNYTRISTLQNIIRQLVNEGAGGTGEGGGGGALPHIVLPSWSMESLNTGKLAPVKKHVVK